MHACGAAQALATAPHAAVVHRRRSRPHAAALPAPASCVALLHAQHGAARRAVTAAAAGRSRAATSTGDSSTEAETVSQSRSARAALLRARLVAAAAALGPGALLPAWQAGGSGGDSARRDAESALTELLALAPPGSLPGPSDAPLDGAWELVYATRGTVVTRALQPPGPLAGVPRPTVSAIVQTLTPSPTAGMGVLAADNAACVDLGPLGTWRLRALGRWTPQPRSGGFVEALVAFDAFGLEAVSLFGQKLDGRLPALRVPLPTPLTQRGALFRTLYLDADTRVAEALGAPPGRPGGGGGLILPGSEGFPESYAGAGDGGSDPRQGPGPGRGGPRPGGFAPVAPTQHDGPLYQPFRPPAQYKETAVLPKQELLNRLITRSGRWFELAKALDALHATGTPNTEVFEMTGLTPLEQNAWKVQAAVYVSLEASEEFPKELLAHYHDEHNAASLAELRQTPEEWRVAAARYVAERKFDVNATRELARAILDFERRPDTTKTFEATPGDALAFKLWRDAGEVPRRMGWKKAVAACVERGCGFASSEAAKARLRSRLDEDERALPGMAGAESGAGRVAATVQTVRLETEESAFRALPLLGSLDDLTPAAVRGAPSAVAEGVFRAFRPTSGAAGLAWVALPAWAKLQALDSAVAMQVPNAATLKAIPAVCSTPGQILLIVDRAAATGPTSAQHYYIAAKKASSLLVGVGGRPLPERIEVVAGGSLAGAPVLGRVVLVVRPPALGAAKPKNLPEGLRDLGDSDLGDMPDDDNDVMAVAIPDDD